MFVASMACFASFLVYLDLLLMLRNPFHPVNKRLPPYRVAGVIWAVASAAYGISQTPGAYALRAASHSSASARLIGIASIIIVVLNLALIFKLKRLSRGVNQELSEVFYRHYLLMFLAMLPFYAAASYRAVQPDHIAPGATDWRRGAISQFEYVVHLSRLVFVIDRVRSDPYLLQNLLPMWNYKNNPFRRKHGLKSKRQRAEEEDLYKGGTLNAFLNSSSNIDYVY